MIVLEDTPVLYNGYLRLKVKTIESNKDDEKIGLVAMNWVKKVENTELKFISIDIDKETPQEIGTKVRFTANAEGENLKYRFYIYKGNKQVYRGDSYTTQNYLDYTLSNVGTYKAVVYVIDGKGSYGYKYSNDIEIVSKDIKLNINSISIEKESHQDVVPKLKWVVNADGNNLKYRFYIYNGNKQVYKGERYSVQDYLEYTPKYSGNYRAIVYVIDDNGNYEYKYSDEIEIKDIKLKINKISIDKESPQEVGTKVKWNVDAKGYNLRYKFYIYKGSKQVYKGDCYTTNNCVEYTPNSIGTYKVIVYVIDGNGDYEYKYSNDIEIISKTTELRFNSISVNKQSPQKIGTKIKWTANVEGNNLKYKFYIYKGIKN